MESNEDKLYCPHCGSSQLVANRKGFGAGKALTGAILTGGVGLLAGFIGSDKIKITCLKCGKNWKPKELLSSPLIQENKYPQNGEQMGCITSLILWAFVIMFIVAIIMTFY